MENFLYPDVMMECYKHRPISVLFFILYIIIIIVLLLPSLLALVYDNYHNQTEKQWKKIYIQIINLFLEILRNK